MNKYMKKIKSYWERWELCCKENGFKYSVKKAFKRLFKRSSVEAKSVSGNQSGNRNDHNKILIKNLQLPSGLNIAIKIEGGVGDYVIAANYVYKFKQKYHIPAMNIDLFYVRNFDAIKGIFGENLADRIFLINNGPSEGELYRKYDLFIRLSRYPLFVNRNPQKIQMYQPELLTYLLALEKFKWKYTRFFDDAPFYDGQTAMVSNIHGVKRFQQGDIDGILGITEKYEHNIEVSENEEIYLHELGLSEDSYIIVVASADARCAGNQNNKVWPDNYWNLLIEKIKVKYPKYKTVLIGSEAICDTPINVDLDLSGKTDMESVKILLKNALLLISSEGGMVHLRYALTLKKSIVLFGPTDPDFYGYTHNINLRTDVCKYPCEWFCRDWFKNCSHREYKACMWSLSPRAVMNAVDEFFKESNINEQV